MASKNPNLETIKVPLRNPRNPKLAVWPFHVMDRQGESSYNHARHYARKHNLPLPDRHSFLAGVYSGMAWATKYSWDRLEAMVGHEMSRRALAGKGFPSKKKYVRVSRTKVSCGICLFPKPYHHCYFAGKPHDDGNVSCHKPFGCCVLHGGL